MPRNRRLPSLIHLADSAFIFTAVGTLTLLALAGCASEKGAIDPDESPIESWSPGHHGAWSEVTTHDPKLNLLLISLDTTRADHLSCYGFRRQTTPNLDQLAAEGVLFERGTAPVPVTLPSHTSMMTGLYPFHHGVRNNGTYVVADTLTTLAETLQSQGYKTGAIVGAFPVASQFQIDQGFDHFDDDFPATSVRRESDTAQRVANDITDLSLEFLDGLNGNPFFLWSHYFDPHHPYDPPEPHQSNFAGDPYAGEIAFTDAEIGRLIEGLRDRNLLETTVIMVVGDHGESLGQHGEMTHSIFIYNSTQYVPFLLRFPQSGPFTEAKWRGQRVGGLVSLVDLFPTAINALGLPRDLLPPNDGKSLLPASSGDGYGHNWVYYESLVPRLEYAASDLRAIETDTHKYIRAPRKELYEIQTDPDEESDVSQRDTWIVDEMDAQMSGLLRDEGDAAPQVQMDEETIERLRSLGYLAGSNNTTATEGPLPDPKEMIWAYELINAARAAMAQHRPDAALGMVDSVLVSHPDDQTARRIRASALIRLDRGPESVEAYDELIENCVDCPDQLDLLRNRAIAAFTNGDIDDALERIDALLETHPDEPGYHTLRGQILEAKGDVAGARQELEREIELHPEDVTAISILAEIEMQQGNTAEAEKLFRRSLTINGYHVPSLVNVAEILIATDREFAARGLIEQAYATDPTYPGVLYRKGWFAKIDGDTNAAIDYYVRSLDIDPNNRTVFHNLGNIYLNMSQIDGALHYLQLAIDTGSARQPTYVSMGVAKAQGGNFEEAISYWETAIEMEPDSEIVPSIRENIGLAKQRIQEAAGN